MADSFNGPLPTVNPVTFGNGLPPEYQQQIDTLLRQRAMAQMMMQQSMQPTPQPTNPGPVASKMSLLQPLMQALSGYMANRNATSAEQGIGQVQNQYQNETTQAIKALQDAASSNGVQAAITQGEQSRNPIVQQLVAQWKTQANQRLHDYAANLGENNPQGTARALTTGNINDAGIIPTPPTPRVDMLETGPGLPKVPMVTNTGKGGYQTGAIAPGGTTVNLPGTEAADALTGQRKELEEWKGDAKTAMKVMNDVNFAVDALRQGAQAGGLAEQKQVLKQALQGIGASVTGLDTIQQLQAALGGRVIDTMKEMGARGQAYDIAFLKNKLGAINTDPTALSDILNRSYAGALKTLHDYQDFVAGAQKTALSPYARQLYQNSLTGYDSPETLPGPISTQMGIASNYIQRGGSPDRFNLEGVPLRGKGANQKTPQFNLRPQAVTPFNAAPGVTPPPATTVPTSGASIGDLVIDPKTGKLVPR